MSDYIEQSAKEFQSYDDVMSHIWSEVANVEELGLQPRLIISHDVFQMLTGDHRQFFDFHWMNRGELRARKMGVPFRWTVFGWPARVITDACDTCIVEGYEVV